MMKLISACIEKNRAITMMLLPTLHDVSLKLHETYEKILQIFHQNFYNQDDP